MRTWHFENVGEWTFLSGIGLGNLEVMTMTANDLQKAQSRLFRDSAIDTSLDEILWNFNSLSEINRIKSNRATNQKSAFMWSSWCIYFCFGSLLFRYCLLHEMLAQNGPISVFKKLKWAVMCCPNLWTIRYGPLLIAHKFGQHIKRPILTLSTPKWAIFYL